MFCETELEHIRQFAEEAIMGKAISQIELKSIAHKIKLLGGAATVSQLAETGESRAQILRRIHILMEGGQIRAEGSGKNKHYILIKNAANQLISENKNNKNNINSEINLTHEGIPFSNVSNELRSLINRPLSARTPIGYDRSFVESYVPNESAYFSKSDIKRLFLVGTAISPHEQAPAGTYARQILNRLLIDLSWNSSRLEGNTYSLLDTMRLIEFGQGEAGKAAQETQMILNHKAAIEFIVDPDPTIGMNSMTIRNIHALLSDNLLDPPELSGTLRKGAVAIAASTYIPLANQSLISGYFELVIQKASAIVNPFEQSLFLMIHLPYLQPFIDVNKRTSRLAANIPLVKANLFPLSFVDVPHNIYTDAMMAVYEYQRIEILAELYIWAYERSSFAYKSLRTQIGQPDPFRSKYREQLIDTVGAIVRGTLLLENAGTWIRNLKNVAESDNDKFVQILNAEILMLNEGNFARYRIRPQEWFNWAKMNK